MPKIVLLWTDIVVWLMVVAGIVVIWHARRSPNLRKNWAYVGQEPSAMAALIVMACFVAIGLLDSVHFRRLLPDTQASTTQISARPASYATKTESLLDVIMSRQIQMREKSYSLPLAYQGFLKESQEVNGKTERIFPRLEHGGRHLTDPQVQWQQDVISRAAKGVVAGTLFAFLVALLVAAALAQKQGRNIAKTWEAIATNQTTIPWRAMLLTVFVLCLIAGPIISLAGYYHVLGTDRTGNDILYQALKSVRTAFVIGSLTTIATLPFAIVLGVAAGYFKGWVDDVIQYFYTTLSSIPSILLIAACVLMIQVFIDKNPQLFETGIERADLKLFFLCIILGVTGWAGLCRLLRAETMKLRELDYVQAARAFGASPFRIMAKHIVPNVMHLVLITTVLSFSELVLYEAVLSYVGVGVDPSMNSFGGMINLARSEMGREPTVWWSFASAFVFMVTLVLSANLLADAVRDAFDPRARKFRKTFLKPQPVAA
ncbi:MAG: ABC transporter permease [Burkholderiaceae bacterium]|nr:ABC transporter permease [Burkholderiaceae bacterium]